MDTIPALTGSTRMAFLFGCPLRHSLSPAMQNAAFARLRLPVTYAPLEVAPSHLASAVQTLHALNVLGANITVPYKGAVLPYLDEVDAESRWLRSVNTVFKKGARLYGTSTDGRGFLRSLGPKARSLMGASVLLVGAGGGARAVAGAILQAGVKKVFLTDRIPSRVAQLVRMLKQRRRSIEAHGLSQKEAERSIGGFSLVVQATPLGLHPGDPSPLSLHGASQGSLAVDLIYHRKTAFLKEASSRGMTALSGLGMLLHQGALSFETWTKRKAPLAVMEHALHRAIPRSR